MNSTVFNSTVATASHRLEEKQYGDEIFRNIHALALFHKPTDQLTQVLSRDMFYKANTKAFAHVMHFLFTIVIDPREFRKHFFWPIIDKAGETNFRTTSMTQMNLLIQKHSLALEPIKMHIVVLPGGLKFMKILHEFTMLAMKETVAKQSKGEESTETHPLNTNCRLEEQRCKQFLEVTKAMDESCAQIQKSLHKIQATIQSLAAGLSVNSDLLDRWQSELDAQVSHHIEPKFKSISLFAKQCAQLNDQVQTISANRHKQFVAIEKDDLKRCQTQLCEWLPSKEMQNTVRNMFVLNEFNYANILTIFEAILPTIVQHIGSFQYRRLDEEVVQFESEIINKMCAEVLALKTDSDAQLKRVETYFEYAQCKYPMVDNKENESPDDPSHHRFISTPPIRSRPNGLNAIMHTHLPWKFEDNMRLPPPSAKKSNRSFLGTPTRSFHGTPNKATNSMNASIVTNHARSNAMTMLNMVRERCTARTDNRMRHEPSTNFSTSLLKSNSKTLNFLSPTTATTSSKTTTSTSKFISGVSSTRVFTEKLFESTTLSPDTIVLHQRRETSSVIHLQNDNPSLPIHDANFLRTSPSGRFIIPDSNPTRTLALDDTAFKSDNTTICAATPMSGERTIIEATSDNGSDTSNAMLTARKIYFSPDSSSQRNRMPVVETEDTLLNVSDSVLHDISM